MADGRRIVFGSYVVPQEGESPEESLPSKYILLQQDSSGDAVAKTFGGKSTVVEAEIQANQWSDTWVSFAHSQMNWEDWDEDEDIYGNFWEDSYEAWDGLLSIGTSAVQLSHSTASSNSLVIDKTLAFVYVKNTGDTTCYLSCVVGGGSGYNIKIRPGGSVQFRGGAADTPNCDDIYVKTLGSTTTIEYVLAKSEA